MEVDLQENPCSELKNQEKKTTKEDEEKNHGIIYLSRIPTKMNVAILRQYLSIYGEMGRIFLQVDEKKTKRKKRDRGFTEGWVEFIDKKVAKRVAKTLNTQMIGGKRRNPWYEELWNMKYLPKFKWIHLCERLEYEKESRKQRMKTEIKLVKLEAEHYQKNAAKHKFSKKRKFDSQLGEWSFEQKMTEDEMISKKKKKTGPAKLGEDKNFLQSLFSGGRPSMTEKPANTASKD